MHTTTSEKKRCRSNRLLLQSGGDWDFIRSIVYKALSNLPVGKAAICSFI